MRSVLPLRPRASRRREDLWKVKSMLDEQIAPLDQAVAEAALKDERARLLMTQPGVGPITSMAFVLTMGDVSRFPRGKQVASYLGLIPREYSSGGKQRLGSISKQGNWFMRMLLVEAAQSAVRCDPQMRNEYLHRCHRKAKGMSQAVGAPGVRLRYTWRLRMTRGAQMLILLVSCFREPLRSRKLDRRVDWALSYRSNHRMGIQGKFSAIEGWRRSDRNWIHPDFRTLVTPRSEVPGFRVDAEVLLDKAFVLSSVPNRSPWVCVRLLSKV